MPAGDWEHPEPLKLSVYGPLETQKKELETYKLKNSRKEFTL